MEVDQETPTQEQSSILMRNLVRTTLATLFWARAIFNSDCFENRAFSGMTVKKLRSGASSESDSVQQWIEDGVLDAFKKGYLDTLIVGVETNEREGTRFLCESYNFSFNYDDGTMSFQSSAGSLSRSTFQPNKHNIRNSALQMLRNIALVVQTFTPLPETRFVVMKILYRDSVTPPDYEPPHFRSAADEAPMMFSTAALKVKVGRVQTLHHRLDLMIQTTADALAPSSQSSDSCQPETAELDSTFHSEEPRLDREPSSLVEIPDSASEKSCSDTEIKTGNGTKSEGGNESEEKRILEFTSKRVFVTANALVTELGLTRKHASETIDMLEKRKLVGKFVRNKGRLVNKEALLCAMQGAKRPEEMELLDNNSVFGSESQGPQSTPPQQVSSLPSKVTPMKKSTATSPKITQYRKRKTSIAEDPHLAKRRR